RSVLGESDPTAQAAGQNPFSTRAQLNQQHDRNTRDLTEQLNAANLLYSGHRIVQEGDAANSFQNALAQAAAGVNSGLGQIGGNLTAALSSNEAQRVAALQDAYNRHATEAGAADQAQQLQDMIAQLLGGATGGDAGAGYAPDAGGNYG